MEVVIPETGLVVEQGDMKGLLAAVREILAKGKSHYTDACRMKAVKDYNKDVQYGKYIELYNKIVKH